MSDLVEVGEPRTTRRFYQHFVDMMATPIHSTTEKKGDQLCGEEHCL